MNYRNYSFKARLSGVLLATALLISPVVVSAGVLDDMAATLAAAAASLDKIMSSLSTTQQAQVTGGGGGGPTITVTSPNGGETLFVGDSKTITWISSSVIDKVSIGWSTGPGSLNWIANNIPNTNSYNWNVNVGNTTNTQFKIQIIGYQTGTGSVTDESDNFFTVGSSGGGVGAAPAIAVIGTPTLVLTYDSAGKEAALSATFDVTVTAGSTNFKLYKYGVFDADTHAFLVTLNNANGANNSANNGNFYKTSGTATDNSTYWTISAGQTAAFRVTSTLSSPNTLFSGSYNATISIYKPSGSVSEVGNIPNNTTNSLTIIGERAPYITSVSTMTDVSGAVIGQNIWGIRFHPTSNQVTINGVTKTLPTGASDKGPYITFKSSDFGITSSGSYMIQVSTAEGASNKHYAIITVPTTTTPTITVVGTPTLALTYDSAGKEVLLVANYTIQINAGSQALSFPSYAVSGGSWLPVSISLLNTAGQSGSVSVSTYGPTTIPAGTSATYNIRETANPNQLFAGAYTGTVNPVIYTGDPTNTYQTALSASISGTTKTNSLTIVGERAPYISGVTSDANGNVTVSGARLNLYGNVFTIDGKAVIAGSTLTATSWSFNASSYGLASGSHYIQITNSQTGNSNTHYFTVSMTTQPPIITVTSPNGGEVLFVGNTRTITWKSSTQVLI